MALIKCPECGKEISNKAPACIYCGYPLTEQDREVQEDEEQERSVPLDDLKKVLTQGRQKKSEEAPGIEDDKEGLPKQPDDIEEEAVLEDVEGQPGQEDRQGQETQELESQEQENQERESLEEGPEQGSIETESQKTESSGQEDQEAEDEEQEIHEPEAKEGQTQSGKFIKDHLKMLVSIIIVAVAVIVVILLVVRSSRQNIFTEFAKPIGQPYSELMNGEYEVEEDSEGIVLYQATEDIFGVPGEIEYYAVYNTDEGDYDDIFSAQWESTNTDLLTQEQMTQFLNGMTDTLGEYDREEHVDSDDYWGPYMSYYWDNVNGFTLSLNTFDSLDYLIVVWMPDEEEYDDAIKQMDYAYIDGTEEGLADALMDGLNRRYDVINNHNGKEDEDYYKSMIMAEAPLMNYDFDYADYFSEVDSFELYQEGLQLRKEAFDEYEQNGESDYSALTSESKWEEGCLTCANALVDLYNAGIISLSASSYRSNAELHLEDQVIQSGIFEVEYNGRSYLSGEIKNDTLIDFEDFSITMEFKGIDSPDSTDSIEYFNSGDTWTFMCRMPEEALEHREDLASVTISIESEEYSVVNY